MQQLSLDDDKDEEQQLAKDEDKEEEQPLVNDDDEEKEDAPPPPCRAYRYVHTP